MSDSQDRRGFERFRIPVVIDAPGLCVFPLVPEDVSAGGFRVSIPDRPEMGAFSPCAIQFGDDVFEDCEGQVMWVRPDATDPDLWSVGIAVRTMGPDQVRLDRRLRALSEELGGMISPFV